jgi:class 6 POU domain transcription factor
LIELKAFAEDFKTRRIRLGFTQGSVGQSLAERGFNNFAQSTISRFEQMQLSPANAATIRVILEKWLLEAESPEPSPASTNTIPQIAGRKRKKRAVFTPQTRAVLEEFFSQNPRPNRQAIENISHKLDLLPEEVRVWFCNKRQKSKSGSFNGGMMHRTSFDRESSLSSSGVPSPTYSDGGMSQKNRSPSPPKTPFTIEELSKSSIASAGNPNSPPTPVVSSLGIMASVTQSMSPLFSSGVFSNPLLPASFVANTRA